MLVVRGLSKRFGERVAVDELSLEIAAGEVYGLLGPNGAGKTTSIQMLSGVLSRDAGRVTIDGSDLDEGPPARIKLGLVPQDITLYLDLSARENLIFWGRLYGLTGDALGNAVEARLDEVGLRDRGDDRVETFSGGMKRRLNLAVGLVHEPKLLVLDEPTVGVDPQSRGAIFDLVEHHRARGMAMLYTTHYMEEADRLCDRIGILDDGRLIAEGTRDELVAKVGGETRVTLDLRQPAIALRACDPIAALDGVTRAVVNEAELVAFVDDATRRLPEIWSTLARADAPVEAMSLRAPDLHDVFLGLTGRELRDE